jgi:hypothetical protein
VQKYDDALSTESLVKAFLEVLGPVLEKVQHGDSSAHATLMEGVHHSPVALGRPPDERRSCRDEFLRRVA